MEEYLSRLEKAATKYKMQCDEYEKKALALEEQDKAGLAERERLAQIVKEQNLSEVDVHRLTADRQELDAKLRTARSEKDEKSRIAYQLEMKRSHAFGTIEKLVDDYEAKATKLGLIPQAPAGYEHIQFHQQLHGGATAAAGMVPDCTSQIKPAILRLKQDTVAAKNEEEETVIGLEEEISELKNRIASKDVEAQEAETRYKNELAELESTREVRFAELACGYS